MAITELNFEITPNGLQKLAKASLANPVNLVGMQLFRGQTINDPLDYSLCSDIETYDPLDETEPEIVISPLGGKYDYLANVMGIEGIDNTANEYTAKTCCIYWEEYGERQIFAIVSQTEIAFTKLVNSALTVTLNFALSQVQSQVITFSYSIDHPIASTSWTGAVQLATNDQVAAGQQMDGASPLVMQAGQGCSLISGIDNSLLLALKENTIGSITNPQDGVKLDTVFPFIFSGMRIMGVMRLTIPNYSSLTSGTPIINNGQATSEAITNCLCKGYPAKGVWKYIITGNEKYIQQQYQTGLGEIVKAMVFVGTAKEITFIGESAETNLRSKLISYGVNSQTECTLSLDQNTDTGSTLWAIFLSMRD